MIFEIWLKTACSSGLKWEKSSSGSSISVSDCSSEYCLVLFFLWVKDWLVGSKEFETRLLVRSTGMWSVMQDWFMVV